MALTLRNLQKILSRSARGARVAIGSSDRDVIAGIVNLIDDEARFAAATINDGVAVNPCDCEVCRRGKNRVDIRSQIDAWTREHGPNTDLETLLREKLQEKTEQQQEENEQGEDGNGEQPEDGQPQPSQQGSGKEQDESEQGQPNSRAQQTGSAPGKPADSEQNVPAPPQVSPERQKLEQAKTEVAEALKEARKKPGDRKAEDAVSAAKKSLRKARKKASFNRAAMVSSPSLSARKSVASTHGRLQRVPQKLRSQMADLINRLVSQAGTTGEQLGHIPVLSANKLVRRMLVKRPLRNAFKEDSVSGRPVTLFLPDVSPSCAAQAQHACDLANAAGYAGVKGSDVLVLPHFNGLVNSDENLIPWFNGKPVATNPAEIKQIFADVCGGRSKFKVRVAVFIGDHDAVDQYGSIAALKTVRRVVWLHNFRDSWSQKDAQPVDVSSAGYLCPDWPPEVLDKLSMMSHCVTMSSMLSGFNKALKQHA